MENEWRHLDLRLCPMEEFEEDPPEDDCDDDDDDDDDDEDDEVSLSEGWVSWFCKLEGHEYFVEVDDDYIQDSFNLYGLKPRINNFDKALSMILCMTPPDDELYRDATDLYGLIHSRYIISPKGLSSMYEKFKAGAFGQCPRVYCNKQNVFPVGLSEELRTHRVRVYCPKCQEAYEPPPPFGTYGIDGAFFGVSFPHVFLLTYSNLIPLEYPLFYVPKVFGFRVHKKRSIVQHKLEMGEYGAFPPAQAYFNGDLVREAIAQQKGGYGDGDERPDGGKRSTGKASKSNSVESGPKPATSSGSAGRANPGSGAARQGPRMELCAGQRPVLAAVDAGGTVRGYRGTDMGKGGAKEEELVALCSTAASQSDLSEADCCQKLCETQATHAEALDAIA